MVRFTYKFAHVTRLIHGLKTSSSLFTFVFIFSKISQILKTKLYVLWTQTCRNCTKSIYVRCYIIYHLPYLKKNFMCRVFQLEFLFWFIRKTILFLFHLIAEGLPLIANCNRLVIAVSRNHTAWNDDGMIPPAQKPHQTVTCCG